MCAERRLIVWDYPKGQWGREFNCRRVDNFEELARHVVPGAPPARVAFLRVSEDPRADFDTWSRLAWVAIQSHAAAVVAEELSEVTHVGKAPSAWGTICRMGMGYGSTIIGISQRPAETDKTFLGNAVLIHSGRFNIPDDRATMAKYLDVPLAEVAALKPLEYIERHASGELARGAVTFRKRRK